MTVHPSHRPLAPARRVRHALAAVAALTLTASACAASDEAVPPTSAAVDFATSEPAPAAPGAPELTATADDGTTTFDDGALTTSLDALPAGTLSDADRDALLFMREEEKLALDVYQTLYDTWGLTIFDNIAGAEQTHTDSVKTLLDRWEIPDPALDQGVGVFVNPDLQALYDDLVAKGSESVVDALLVGATIEDLDIADLQARASDNPAVALVFSNLEKGSRNHLRAFVKQLEAQGATYAPVYISQVAYDAIVASPTERGRGG